MNLEGQTVKLTRRGVFLDERGNTLPPGDVDEGKKRTIAYRIMQKHNVSSSMECLNLASVRLSARVPLLPSPSS